MDPPVPIPIPSSLTLPPHPHAAEEEEAVRHSAAQYAAQLGRRAVDVDCVRLACETRRMLQPPLRHAALDSARHVNARTVAWPLGPTVRVPIAAAAAYRTDVLLNEGGGVGSAGAGAGSSVLPGPVPGTDLAAPGPGFAVEMAPLDSRPKIVVKTSVSAAPGGAGHGHSNGGKGGAKPSLLAAVFET